MGGRRGWRLGGRPDWWEGTASIKPPSGSRPPPGSVRQTHQQWWAWRGRQGLGRERTGEQVSWRSRRACGWDACSRQPHAEKHVWNTCTAALTLALPPRAPAAAAVRRQRLGAAAPLPPLLPAPPVTGLGSDLAPLHGRGWAALTCMWRARLLVLGAAGAAGAAGGAEAAGAEHEAGKAAGPTGAAGKAWAGSCPGLCRALPAGMEFLAALTGLEVLDLFAARVTDAGCRHIRCGDRAGQAGAGRGRGSRIRNRSRIGSLKGLGGGCPPFRAGRQPSLISIPQSHS